VELVAGQACDADAEDARQAAWAAALALAAEPRRLAA
jgi:hypothetical protein